ncbi:DUF2946 domain-containing protein [Shewanella sp. A14]
MKLIYHTKNTLTLWLAAILVCLSVVTAVHSLQHIDEDNTIHSLFCSQLHQLQNTITSSSFDIPVIQQTFITFAHHVVSFEPTFNRFFNSRAPPKQKA